MEESLILVAGGILMGLGAIGSGVGIGVFRAVSTSKAWLDSRNCSQCC